MRILLTDNYLLKPYSFFSYKFTSTSGVMTGIPAGTYTVIASMFCAADEPRVVKKKENVVESDYLEPELSFVAAGKTATENKLVSRNSYTGCATGKIVMMLKNGNQRTTPVFTIYDNLR